MAFYFFALTQKSNKKSQGCEKMTKNYFVNLNPANSPLVSFIYKTLLAQIPIAIGTGFLTVYCVIFLTSFFRGRESFNFEVVLINLIDLKFVTKQTDFKISFHRKMIPHKSREKVRGSLNIPFPPYHRPLSAMSCHRQHPAIFPTSSRRWQYLWPIWLFVSPCIDRYNK